MLVQNKILELYDPKKPIVVAADASPYGVGAVAPAVAAARLQRWAVIMSMYDYEIRHISGSKMGHVDALSRLPLDGGTGVDVDRINVLNFGGDAPIQLEDVQQKMNSDVIMRQVYDYVMNGWKTKVSSDLMPYFLKRKNLSTEDHCIYYVNRIRYCENENDGKVLRMVAYD